MAEVIDTDIETVPYEPIESTTWWPYGPNATKLAYRLNKEPGDIWVALFTQTVKEHITSTNQLLAASRVTFESRGRPAITCIVNSDNKDAVLTAIRGGIAATNEKAKGLNADADAKRKTDIETGRNTYEASKRLAESMSGK